jgi:hypothetical protein
MKTFLDYFNSFEINIDSDLLDFGIKDSDYFIYKDSSPLLTPAGNVFSHPAEGVIRLLITDLQLFNTTSLQMLSSPILYSFRKDNFKADDDTFLHQWKNLISTDPFVLIKTAGNQANQLFSPDDPLFSFTFITLTGLIDLVNDFAGKAMGEIVMEESDLHPFPEILRLSYNRLSPDQKVAVQALSSVHKSGIVIPLLLVLDEISPVEYVKGLISLKLRTKERYSETLAEVVRVQAYLDLLIQKREHGKTILALIKDGEGDVTEFKSTLRWDIRAGKTNPAIERSCLKTIAAFLNSKGGNLLIGVRDDGSIEGIETDKFANEDKFLLHLWTLIRTCLGRDFSSYIRTRLENIDEKNVCVVDCLPSSRPAFLHQPGFDEEMYIRVGPSSNALDISEALKYIEDRFHVL